MRDLIGIFSISHQRTSWVIKPYKTWSKDFDCTGVCGFNGRNDYSTFEYFVQFFNILFCIFQCLLGPPGSAT